MYVYMDSSMLLKLYSSLDLVDCSLGFVYDGVDMGNFGWELVKERVLDKERIEIEKSIWKLEV